MKITSSSFANMPQLSQQASSIASELEDFFGKTADIEDRDDYLDEYDDDAIVNAIDALRYFADNYKYDAR